MKKNNKIIIIASIISILLLITVMVIKNTNDCSGCGGCTYSEFIDEISVDKIFYTGKEINKISFHSVLDTDKVYVLTIEQLTALNLKFEIIEFIRIGILFLQETLQPRDTNLNAYDSSSATIH